MKFDGKGFAQQIEAQVQARVAILGRKPKIVSVLVGDDPASVLYTKLKKEAAERVGIRFEVVKQTNIPTSQLRSLIAEIGAREDVSGVMIQLPVPGLQGQALKEVLEAIPLTKDVDGLRYPESGVVPPVVKAILEIVNEVEQSQIINSQILKSGKYVVVGASGFVGNAICRELEKTGKQVIRVEAATEDPTRMILEGEVVISCVGKEGLITAETTRPGAVVIDVGAPKGDMTREVYQKASISVEVPGGVGPVTVASLMRNVIDFF